MGISFNLLPSYISPALENRHAEHTLVDGADIYHCAIQVNLPPLKRVARFKI